jgi:Family of unknown function (DUF5302)
MASSAKSDPPADPAKDKFRAALERKRSQQHAGNGPAANDSKVHGEHSREGGKRTFRRKSG